MHEEDTQGRVPRAFLKIHVRGLRKINEIFVLKAVAALCMRKRQLALLTAPFPDRSSQFSAMEGTAAYGLPSLSHERTIELSMDGKSVEMNVQQITTASLARIFSVSPDSIWLQQTIGNKTYLPNEDGTFCGILGDRNSIYGLVVHGLAIRSQNNTSSLALTAPSASSRDTPPVFKSVMAKKNKSKLKIVRANLRYAANGKPMFENIDVLYIDIDEATSNVPSLLKVIQEEFGDNYVLLTNDGLMIKDSSATRGM